MIIHIIVVYGVCSKMLHMHKQVVVRRIYLRQAKEDSEKEYKTKSSQLPFHNYKKALQEEV